MRTGAIKLAWIIFGLALPGGPMSASAQNTVSEFWPEIDGYVNLGSTSRLWLRSIFTKDEETDARQADLGVHFDFALKPVFRRDLRTREDVFKRRYLSFRTGFRYITSVGDASSPYLEHRWVLEAISRYPLPKHFVVIDSNRGEARFINGQPFSTRYRNKLQIERDLTIGSFVLTPYANGQLYYDTRYGIWNRNRYSFGAQFPFGDHLVLDTYYLRQNDSRSNPEHVNAIGLGFYFYF